MALTYKALAVLLAYPTADTQELAAAAVQAIEEEGMVPLQVRRSLGRLADELANGDLF
jgi:nitrate reductase delta subunit